MTDGGSTDGARFCAFGQHNAFTRLAGGLHHVEAELGGRKAVGGGCGSGGQCGCIQAALRTQVGQTAGLGGCGIANYAGKIHGRTGKRLHRQRNAFVRARFIGRYQYHFCIERSGQRNVLRCQKSVFAIGFDALDDSGFFAEGGGFADQCVQPVVCFALCNQGFGTGCVCQRVEYGGIGQCGGDGLGGGCGIGVCAGGEDEDVCHGVCPFW